MKKGIALLAAVGLIMSMAVPVAAEEQITTYKGDQELVLTEAGDVDLTKEELAEKSGKAMKDAEDLAIYMKMDVEANISYDAEGTEMSMDMVMKADMSDNKKGGLEYRAEKMNMSFFGMNMDQESEEYIFPNADGKKVSVRKETSSESEEENNGEWVAEAVGEMEDLEEDVEDSSIDTFLSDDMFESFELLDKMYTDGEKNYYVLKAKTADVMSGGGFGSIEEVFGEIDTDAECYMLFSEDGMIESMYIDLSGLEGVADEEQGVETSFSKFMVSLYSDAPVEIVIPEEVQAAGDAAA